MRYKMKDDNRARRIKYIKIFIAVLLTLGVYPIALLSVDSSTALKIFIASTIGVIIIECSNPLKQKDL